MKELFTSEISDLKKKLEENPEPSVFVSLADAYRKEGYFDEARKVCLRGIEKNPGHWNTHFVLGRIYQEQSKSREAVAEFKKVLEIDPENLMVHSFLGALFMKLEDYKEAIDEYQAVLTINPDDEEAQEFLKTAIEKAASAPKGKVAAKETVEDESAKKADHGIASITMAELYFKQGHLDKALEVYEEILKKDPNHAVARQKASELKAAIAVDSLGDVSTPKLEAPKPISKDDQKKNADARKKDAKFTDEDIFQVMSMERTKTTDATDKKTAAVSPKEELKIVEKALEQSKEAEKNAEPSSSFSPAQVDVLKGTLAELASITGIRGCFLTSLEGISVVSIGENGNNEALEKQVLLIFKDTNQSASKLNQGSLRQVLVTADTGHILLVSFAGGVLVVLADHQINLGMLRLAMDGAAKKIEKVK